MKKLLLIALLGLMSVGASAQRYTDKLNRGLVAIPQGDKTGQDSRYGVSGSGIFVSWRILPGEYYDTKYNVYRGATKIASNLTVSNYQDNSGTKTSTYKVVPVIRGTERQDLAAECKPWDHQYWQIPVKPVVNRNGATVGGYSLNDCSVADVDGDGQMEFVVKRRNDSGNLRSASNNTDFNLHECYKMDGTRLWWIDMGPNLMAGPDEQFDLILYDWDQDGKAEGLMRGADNMIIHTATGKTIKIGNMNTGLSVDRPEYMGVGNEYLLYINGATGEPYGWDGSENWTPMAYPLPQFEAGETKGSDGVWGDLGHRMQKHYFGAPYLDGRNPSIFLGRGCYTRHKFCALDVNPTTHELTQRWRWNCYDGGSPWFGNGFHNYAIADVDMDGRDEIVFGSMIIDDTGYGLATTGYGHGDAQHCGDLDPYRWGLEQFVCLESAAVPGVAYTDATTQTLRYTTGGGGDNGRCMAGNFYNSYPGAIGISGGAISLVADKANPALTGFGDDHVNCRIYWDGDLLEEFMDSPGTEKSPCVYKAPGQNEVGTNRSYANSRCWMGQGNLNNSSKNNACFLGDIIGDWREEIVTRTDNALVIQVSSYPSSYGITSLWYDHEYRNAMTWQSVGYNQPPHTSFFLGEMEGITNCPPAITLEGRTEVQNGGTIQTTDDHLLVSGYENKTIAVADGASPYILTVNAPAWVKGSGGTLQGDGSVKALTSTPKQPKQTVETYTMTLTGGGFSGATRLVKQGEGVLVLPNVTEKHTGATDVWNGTLVFDGTMEASPVWLNRHTSLVSNGGRFMGGVKAEYNATIYPGGRESVGSLTTTTLDLGFGARIFLDGANGQFDQVNADKLSIEVKTSAAWKDYGPRYKAPVITINYSGQLAPGTYVLGAVGEITGTLSEISIEGVDNTVKVELKHEDGQLKLIVAAMRQPGEVIWNGVVSNSTWQQAVTENFLANGVEDCSADGDDVVFNDDATWTTVTIKGAVSPKSVTFNNETKAYTINGDSIVGGGTLTKNGKGKLTLNNWNHIGNSTINGGTVVVTSLANNTGQDWGALGSSKQTITLNDGTTLQTNGTIITDQVLNVSGDVTIDVPSSKSVIFNKAIKGSGATVIKTGAGSMETGTVTNTYSKLIVKGGTMRSNFSSTNADMLPKTVEFQGGTLWGANMEGGSGVSNNSNFIVPSGKTGTFYGSFRGTYTGVLTGEGTFNVYTGGVRCYWNGNWSGFTGTVSCGKENRQNKKTYDPVFDFNNTYGLPKATLNVKAEVTVSNDGKNFPVGKITGTGKLIGDGTWRINGLDGNMTLNTTIESPVAWIGTGKLTLNIGKVAGALSVESGTVTFNNAALSTLLHGANTTTLKGSGRLVGQGLLNALTMQSGTELIPCASVLNETTPGTIKCNNAITVNSGAVVNFLIGAKKNSTITTKDLTMKGTVKVTFVEDRQLEVGEELTLWTVSGYYSGTPTFDLPDSYVWDTSRISEGILKVVSVATRLGDAARLIENGKMINDKVYDLRGRQTGKENLPAGIYIRNGRKMVVR